MAYSDKGDILTKLGDTRKTQQAYEKARQLGYNG
jgi:predicted negative regulator of RcsB-dependent stress response